MALPPAVSSPRLGPSMPVACDLYQLVPGLFIWQYYDSTVKADLYSSAIIASGEIYVVDPILLEASQLGRLRRIAPLVGIVVTTGNAQNTNFTLSNKFVYKWTKSDLTFDAAALRTESKERVLTNPNGNVDESRDSKVTSERYSAGGKYRYNVTDRFLWYAAAGWYRDRPGGIQNNETGGAWDAVQMGSNGLRAFVRVGF